MRSATFATTRAQRRTAFPFFVSASPVVLVLAVLTHAKSWVIGRTP